MIAWRLACDELDEVDAQVLAVAAVARAVDARLLAAVLPGHPIRTAYRGLRQLSVAEPVGARVTLHDVVRSALRADLRVRDRPWYDELRRRIADHLHDRALSGEPRLVLDLAGLLDDRCCAGASTAAAARATASTACKPVMKRWPPRRPAGIGTRWWRGVRRFLTDAPERVAVVRDAEGALVGFCIAVNPGQRADMGWRGPDRRSSRS